MQENSFAFSLRQQYKCHDRGEKNSCFSVCYKPILFHFSAQAYFYEKLPKLNLPVLKTPSPLKEATTGEVDGGKQKPS